MPAPIRSLAERLFDKVEITSSCWLWTGAVNKQGYGAINRGGRGEPKVRVHVASYELLIGPVPEGLELDHLCRVRRCVKPSHLEAVTHAENMRRARGFKIIRPTPAWCRHGHAMTEDNIYATPRGSRTCRQCKRDKQARWKKHRAEAQGG